MNAFIRAVVLFVAFKETFSSKCIDSLRQQDCKTGEVLTKNSGIGGVCSGCESGLGLRDTCRNSEIPCTPGLECVGTRCQLDLTSCWYTRHLSASVTLLPQCDLSGHFEPVQCKGDMITGRCFCSSEDGKKIFGSAWWKEAKDMTCACSRWKHKLESMSRMDAFLHCEQNGNYEELQCTNKICWCADPKTGMLQNGTRMVPISWWKRLPCYDAKEHGDHYPRQCESVAFGLSTIRELLALHGTTTYLSPNTNCDYDGSHGEHIVQNGIVYCTWRDGEKIGTYSGTIEDIVEIDCACARDTVYYKFFGIEHTLSCTSGGAYKSLQEQGGHFFCVDKDGIPASPALDAPTDCERYFYYSELS